MSLSLAEELARRQRAHGKDARVAEQKANGSNHRPKGKEYSFQQLWDLGYRLLVPIVPPGAEISERSTILKRLQAGRDDRGKTPGVRGRDGRWRGFDWRPYTADEADLERWDAMGAGTGIKTGAQPDSTSLILIDADTLNEDHARTIRDAVERHFGRLPARIGRYPKVGYPIRTTEPCRYQRVEFGERDGKGRLLERVELLSDGRQFVAAGIHPATKQPYHWPQALVPYNELPIVPPAALTAFLDDLRGLLPAASEIVREGATTDVNQASLAGPPALVRKTVGFIPNTTADFPTRESWLAVGYAIRAALPDTPHEGLAIFQEWSEKWAGELDEDGTLVINDPGYVEAEWDRMKPPFRRGIGWLCELAEQHAPDQFNIAERWFDILSDEPSPFGEEQKTEGASDVYPVLTIKDIADRPPPPWLVARHIPQTSVGFLYSRPGAGKSFLALDVALHVAASRDAWHGDDIDAAAGAPVLYLAAEGSYGFRNRIRAWCERRGATIETLNDQGRFAMIERTINFMDPEDVARLMRTVRLSIGRKPALIVVDTVSRAMPGADENLQKEMTLFVRSCDALRDAYSCAVLGVHHAGKDGTMRGSTVLQGAGDFVFRLDREEGKSVGFLHCDKQKDAPDGWSERYSFSPVQLQDGCSSLVPERLGQTQSREEMSEEALHRQAHERTALAVIDALGADPEAKWGAICERVAERLVRADGSRPDRSQSLAMVKASLRPEGLLVTVDGQNVRVTMRQAGRGTAPWIVRKDQVAAHALP
ncbi:AAA family ATPase [Xanthobacter flavus]|uniref:AAA family ATPase n=1 Tax=Xanthobacter flavus TaxID=281 RepID=UPI003728B4A9